MQLIDMDGLSPLPSLPRDHVPNGESFRGILDSCVAVCYRVEVRMSLRSDIVHPRLNPTQYFDVYHSLYMNAYLDKRATCLWGSQFVRGSLRRPSSFARQEVSGRGFCFSV